jgi:hypothetical protein
MGERPWGKYYVLADEPNYKLKRIEVKSGTEAVLPIPSQKTGTVDHH